MELVILFIILAQIFAICVSTYLLLLERKYCKHLDWWWEPGVWIFFVITLIPFLGLLVSIVVCVDYTKNIIKELNDRIESIQAQKHKYYSWWDEKNDAFHSISKKIETINAVCVGYEEKDEMITKCLCNELVKEIMPYVSFGKIARANPWNEFEHTATIKVINDKTKV